VSAVRFDSDPILDAYLEAFATLPTPARQASKALLRIVMAAPEDLGLETELGKAIAAARKTVSEIAVGRGGT